ncbi:MAG TPA: CBS domain-containing protein [Solirubrobacteraceae bacterium]|nr:CBS domain-containing protein [Solirubrobacteraceae bacterium]
MLLGGPLLDSNGGRLGQIQDVIARLDLTDALPPVVGLKARIGGRELFVPVARLQELGPDLARTSTTKLNLAQFESRPGEVLLRRDLLYRRVINVATARLVAAHEVELVQDNGTWRVAGIDASFRPRFRRFLPRRLRSSSGDREQFVSWHEIEPFVSHVPTSRLKLASRRLARLHPAQIADLVEAASHEEGEEIMAAVGHDKELEADVFEELDDEHQVEFLRERSDDEVASVLARMASDDAADLLLEIEQERRLPVLNLLPQNKQLKVRKLLGHNPATAGGMMNPDFVSVAADETVAAALRRVRGSGLAGQLLATVCLVDGAGVLVGTVALSDLVCADPGVSLSSLLEDEAQKPFVAPEEDLPEVARLMTDYNLIAMPVVDPEGRPVGMIAVDDVLELLLPEEWRRRSAGARQ